VAPASSLVIPERVEGQAIAALVVRDTVKESSADAIAQLRELGIEPILLTGDNEAAAQHVAGQVGIDRVIAGVSTSPGPGAPSLHIRSRVPYVCGC